MNEVSESSVLSRREALFGVASAAITAVLGRNLIATEAPITLTATSDWITPATPKKIYWHKVYRVALDGQEWIEISHRDMPAPSRWRYAGKPEEHSVTEPT